MAVAVSRRTAIDVALGLLLGWLGWLGAHVRLDDGRRFDRRGEPWPEPFARPSQISSPWLELGLLAVVLGVVVRRRWPRVGFVAVVLGLAGYRAAGAGAGPVYLAVPLAVVALATRVPLRRWLPLLAGLLLIVVAGHWREAYAGLANPVVYAELFGLVSLAVLPALFALLHRDRRATEQREREQDRRRVADEERLRVAREVHDVVGHSLSVITMQAGVALHLLDKPAATTAADPQVTAALEAIRTTSKQALAELRTTLGVFRADEGAPHQPQSGLARLPDLLAALRAAGQPVRLESSGELSGLPGPVDLAAYRIVQEALTNVVRHAAPATATVSVQRTSSALRLRVSDDGPATRLPAEGNGMLGMRERARSLGGSLRVEVNPPHGLSVVADLPLSEGQ